MPQIKSKDISKRNASFSW